MFLCYYQCRGWSLFCKCSQSRMCLCWIALPLPRSSSRLSNGETESVKTMIVHDEGESDAGSTPCKDSTLIVRQVLAARKKTRQASQSFTTYDSFSVVSFVHSYPKCFSILFLCFVDRVLFFHSLWPMESSSVLQSVKLSVGCVLHLRALKGSHCRKWGFRCIFIIKQVYWKYKHWESINTFSSQRNANGVYSETVP